MNTPIADGRGSVGEEVRAMLARRRVSQERLAAAIGVSGASISRKVRGRSDFTVGELLAVAAFFDVPVGSLLPPQGGPVHPALGPSRATAAA